MPHSADLLCIVPIPAEPEFLFEDSNIWLGRTGTAGSGARYTVYPDGCPVPENKAVIYHDNGICVVRE